ncbi:MAG: TrmH family RNA methyltransferase, partial [Hyphomicrobium sp.]
MTDRPPSTWPPTPRGYFAIGAERMSKSLNLGNLMRSAHGFGASFTFTVGATYRAMEAFSDTSKSQLHLPHYNWNSVDDMALPNGCKLVGIELIENAIDLPS